MRHSKTEKANTRKRIVTIAAKKFREEGLGGIGIADLMKEAGLTVDPPVCVPIAKGTMPAATAAADPLELPPGVCSRFRGFRVGGGSRIAKAAVCVFPNKMAPRSRRCRVRARVSTPLMPTTPWARSSSSSERTERQLDGTRAGSRTT